MASPTLSSRKKHRNGKTENAPNSQADGIRKIVLEVVKESLVAVTDFMSAIQNSMKELHQDLIQLKQSQTIFANQISSMKDVTKCTHDTAEKNTININELLKNNNNLEVNFSAVTRKINRLEQMTMDRDVIISNMEHGSGQENTLSLVEELAEKYHLPLDVENISLCTRMRGKNSNGIAPILVRFDNATKKERFIDATRKTKMFNKQSNNGYRRRIHVNHHWTAAYQEIHHRLRNGTTGHNIWYRRGRFFLRNRSENTPAEIIEIQSLGDIPNTLH